MLGWLDSWRDSEWRDGALGITGGGDSELSGDGRFGITRGSVRDDWEGRPLGTALRECWVGADWRGGHEGRSYARRGKGLVSVLVVVEGEGWWVMGEGVGVYGEWGREGEWKPARFPAEHWDDRV